VIREAEFVWEYIIVIDNYYGFRLFEPIITEEREEEGSTPKS
jgi:hypothetical protein